jgi:hypothetical protein
MSWLLDSSSVMGWWEGDDRVGSGAVNGAGGSVIVVIAGVGDNSSVNGCCCCCRCSFFAAVRFFADDGMATGNVESKINVGA